MFLFLFLACSFLHRPPAVAIVPHGTCTSGLDTLRVTVEDLRDREDPPVIGLNGYRVDYPMSEVDGTYVTQICVAKEWAGQVFITYVMCMTDVGTHDQTAAPDCKTQGYSMVVTRERDGPATVSSE
jgi:hypothetical protein